MSRANQATQRLAGKTAVVTGAGRGSAGPLHFASRPKARISSSWRGTRPRFWKPPPQRSKSSAAVRYRSR
jgi:hypothetical protein